VVEGNFIPHVTSGFKDKIECKLRVYVEQFIHTCDENIKDIFLCLITKIH
jgi:hypothetical protein